MGLPIASISQIGAFSLLIISGIHHRVYGISYTIPTDSTYANYLLIWVKTITGFFLALRTAWYGGSLHVSLSNQHAQAGLPWAPALICWVK